MKVKYAFFSLLLIVSCKITNNGSFNLNKLLDQRNNLLNLYKNINIEKYDNSLIVDIRSDSVISKYCGDYSIKLFINYMISEDSVIFNITKIGSNIKNIVLNDYIIDEYYPVLNNFILNNFISANSLDYQIFNTIKFECYHGGRGNNIGILIYVDNIEDHENLNYLKNSYVSKLDENWYFYKLSDFKKFE